MFSKWNWIFRFSKGHHLGLFILISLIIGIQILIYWHKNKEVEVLPISKEEAAWIASQNEIDSLVESQIEDGNKIYPFNPNFITDYKGYKYGMTLAQIDKLHQFRKQNKYVNSAEEFQNLTGVSNEWMKQYSPYFKFPDWVTQKKKNKFVDYSAKFKTNPSRIIVKDINTASKEELESVYMIGEKTALKIIAEREKLGGYASMEQLSYIWGMSPEAILDLNKKFAVQSNIGLKKIKINDSTTKELTQFPYFNYAIAKNIVTYRSMNGDFRKIDDLTNVKLFPVEKLKIIALYLEF